MEMWGRGGGGGTAAYVLVCFIFRKGIDVYSSFSPRSGKAEFLQLNVFCMNISRSHSQIYDCT